MRRFILVAGLLVAGLLAGTAPANAVPPFGPATMVSAGIPGPSAAAIGADGITRGFVPSNGGAGDGPIAAFRYSGGGVLTKYGTPFTGKVLSAAWDGVSATYFVFTQGGTLKIAKRLENGLYSAAATLASGAVYGVNLANAYQADLVASNGQWWVVWSRPTGSPARRALFQAHTLLGAQGPTQISFPAATTDDNTPTLGYFSGKLNLIWSRVTNPAVNGPSLLRIATSTGGAWAATNLLPAGTHNAHPDSFTSGGTIFVSWQRDGQIVQAQGNTVAGFTSHTFATPGNAPKIGYSGGNLFVGWQIAPASCCSRSGRWASGPRPSSHSSPASRSPCSARAARPGCCTSRTSAPGSASSRRTLGSEQHTVPRPSGRGMVCVMPRVALLVNPTAGRGRGAGVGVHAARLLRGQGHRVQVLAGHSRADSVQLAERAVAEGIDRLVAVGGDGIAQCAVRAGCGRPVVVGVIPCGTGNDLARSVGIPVRDLPAAVRIAGTGAVREIDVLRVRAADGLDEPVVTAVACGFDSRVADRAAGIRFAGGTLRYQLAMVAELASFRPIPFRITIDDEQVELPAMLVAVANGPSYGGGMRICPAAEVDDGLLDVTVISALSRRKLLRIFPTVYAGTHVRHPQVLTFRAARAEVDGRGTTAYGDGEFLTRAPFSATVRARAVQIAGAETSAGVGSDHVGRDQVSRTNGASGSRPR